MWLLVQNMDILLSYPTQQLQDLPIKFCTTCTREKIYVNTLFDTRKKADRTEPFDINKHSHKYYKKEIITKEERNLKKAA